MSILKENKYTEFYEKHGILEKEGELSKEEKQKNQNGFKKLLKVFGLIIIASIIIKTYNSQIDVEIIENGIQEKAVIKDIQQNFYRVNEYEGRTVSNYNIVYEYTIEKRKIRSTYNIDYKKYNDLDIEINDSILILYNSKNVTQNKILFETNIEKKR